MGRTIDKEFVKKYFEENYSDYKLLNDYKNSRTPLKIVHSCGYEFDRLFPKIKKSGMRCKNCNNDYYSNKNRKHMTFEEVVKYISDNGCKFISGEYINTLSVLKYQCNCGEIFTKNFKSFKYSPRCRNCSSKKSGFENTKYTAEDVQKIIYKDGFILDFDDYKNAYTPCNCKCKNGHNFKLTFTQYLYNNCGCINCFFENNRGENNPSWKGGENELSNSIRKLLKNWKIDIMESFNYSCCITNENNGDLVIHHLYSLINIIKDSCNELEIPFKRKIGDYTSEELIKLQNLVLKKHNLYSGIVISKDIHYKFHAIYGLGNNTKEQFNEFLIKNYDITLEEIQSKQKVTPDKEVV